MLYAPYGETVIRRHKKEILRVEKGAFNAAIEAEKKLMGKIALNPHFFLKSLLKIKRTVLCCNYITQKLNHKKKEKRKKSLF